MAAIDHLNGKYGRDTVRCGIFQTDGAWRTRFAKRSPRYTTRWEEICEVKARCADFIVASEPLALPQVE